MNKVKELQDRTLRTREGSPLLDEARNSTQRDVNIPANSVFVFAVVVSSTSGRGRVPQIPEGEGGLVKRTKKT